MKSRNPGLQLSVTTVLALITGTAVAEYAPISSGTCLDAAGLLLFLVFTLRLRWPSVLATDRRPRLLIPGLIIVLLASARWTMARQNFETAALHQLARAGDVTVVLDAVIASVPLQYQRPASGLDQARHQQRWQTRFIAECTAIRTAEETIPASGKVRVFIDGQAGRQYSRGDTVQMTGRLTWPDAPGNPGEFDFAGFLRRRRCAGLFYIAHPDAVRIEQSAGLLSPGYWLTQLRRAAQQALHHAVDPQYRGIAAALLLGSRSEIPAETEEVFIGTGTMHLLAISGLHIGILCLLLVRLGHWLFIPWNRCLLLIAGFCITYAFITDLRPSVVRATVFVILFTLSQLTLRQVTLPTVISQTATLMLVWQPHLVFDTGAWLSFLSVLSLAWADRGALPDHQRDTLSMPSSRQPVPLTPREHLQQTARRMRQWLAARYRPMLWILAATIPLTAWEFHVVSPIGLVINVLLIAWTVLTLWLGFAALVLGILLPFVPNLPGIGFSWMLAGLTHTVEQSASVGIGHVYLPNLPSWFLPAWYVLLLSAVAASHTHHRRLIWLCLCGVISVTLLHAAWSPSGNDFRCTILNVGHGSAAIVEPPGGGVLLIDAGAMNRGNRAGEIVSRCLWHHGHRMINTVIVSHADVDHFNAMGTVLTRFPVGELLVSQQFLHNDSAAAQQLITLAASHQVPIRIATSGDHIRSADTHIDLFQAPPAELQAAQSDNEKSLVVRIRHLGKSILLPGDLEGPALDSLLPQLSHTDVLVSPHHGSRKANTAAVKNQLTPEHVIVSARDDQSRDFLQSVYDSSGLHFTSETGAVDITIAQDGDLKVRHFRSLRTPEYLIDTP